MASRSLHHERRWERTRADVCDQVFEVADFVARDACFAKVCGVSPLPASSGRIVRHRLNQGGNREANSALWRIVLVRLRSHQPTQDYMARRTAEGLSKREIMRCLKRYVAREVFRVLPRSDVATTESSAVIAA